MSNSFPLIIVDESTDARITEAPKKAGYEIFSIQQIMPGTDDINIITVATAKRGYILTEDKDFGDEPVFKKVSNNRAMLLRLAGVDIEEKVRLLLTAIQNHSEELMSAFSVLSKNKLRIRKIN